MSASLTTRIPIRDQRGNVIDEKEVATYAGLLAQAHEEGLKSIETVLVQIPNDENNQVAIATAKVETSRGIFTGIGDASPDNVNARIAHHIIRMAETRAKARALRDAVNIGVVALEELGGENDMVEETRPEPARDNVRPLRPRPVEPPRQVEPSRQNGNRKPDPMTPNQRRLLFRLLSDAGHEGEEAAQYLCEAAGVEDLNDITKARASELIDSWKRAVDA